VDPRIKNYHWLDFVMGLFEAYERGGETVVLTDGAGHVAEGPGFNVFAVSGRTIVTPSSGVLEGVTRRTMIELARREGFDVQVRELGVDELRRADEVFLSSTGGGAIAVAQLDGVAIGGRCGRVRAGDAAHAGRLLGAARGFAVHRGGAVLNRRGEIAATRSEAYHHAGEGVHPQMVRRRPAAELTERAGSALTSAAGLDAPPQAQGILQRRRHMVGCSVEDEGGFDREVMVCDQIAQARRSAAVLLGQVCELLRGKLLDGFADDLQVEQHGVEHGLVAAQGIQVEPSVRRPIFSALAIRSSR
jgi:hypothetical protein